MIWMAECGLSDELRISPPPYTSTHSFTHTDTFRNYLQQQKPIGKQETCLLLGNVWSSPFQRMLFVDEEKLCFYSETIFIKDNNLCACCFNGTVAFSWIMGVCVCVWKQRPNQTLIHYISKGWNIPAGVLCSAALLLVFFYRSPLFTLIQSLNELGSLGLGGGRGTG